MLKAGKHALIGDLDTESIGTPSNQLSEQRAIATAKVEHAGATGNQRGNDVMIGAHQTVASNA